MSIDATLGLMDFLTYFFEKLDKILKDEKVNWKDIPSFIAVLFKVKLAIVGVKNLNTELTHSTDAEITQIVARLRDVTQQLSDIIVKHQSDVFHTSTPEINMADFNEDDFKQKLLDNGVIISNQET